MMLFGINTEKCPFSSNFKNSTLTFPFSLWLIVADLCSCMCIKLSSSKTALLFVAVVAYDRVGKTSCHPFRVLFRHSNEFSLVLSVVRVDLKAFQIHHPMWNYWFLVGFLCMIFYFHIKLVSVSLKHTEKQFLPFFLVPLCSSAFAPWNTVCMQEIL